MLANIFPGTDSNVIPRQLLHSDKSLSLTTARIQVQMHPWILVETTVLSCLAK